MGLDTSVVGKEELIFYTHDNIMDGVNDTNGKKICWLIEPLELVGVNYEQIKQYIITSNMCLHMRRRY